MKNSKPMEFFGMKMPAETLNRLAVLSQTSGLSRAEVIRRLVDSARAMPPVVVSQDIQPSTDK